MPDTTPTPLTAILAAILAAADDAKRAHDQMCDLAETLLPDTQPAPQPPAVVLPTVDEVARTIMLDDGSHGEMGPAYLGNARAVLDLIAARVPVWQPVEPGTVIKAGTHYRVEWDGDGVRAIERTYAKGFTIDPTDPGRVFIDPRTVPAEPDADLVETIAQAIAAGAGDSLDDLYRRDARAILDAIRAEYVIEPKAVQS